LREGQFEAISRGLQGKDTLVLLPTGAGKSIAFQLVALLLPGISLVIDPIIALINDQIDNLNSMGINRVVGISSMISDYKTRKLVIDAFSNGEYLISYIAPERLQTAEFRKALQGLTTITPVPLVAIDEAHCVSEWGHDFRTSYLNIGRISREYCGKNNIPPCIMGLTGTASNAVLKDVQRELEIRNIDAIITPNTFDRSELTYAVFSCSSNEKESMLSNLLMRYFPEEFGCNAGEFFQVHEEETKSGLIFCPHVNGIYGVQDVAYSIRRDLSIPVDFFSGTKPKKIGNINWDDYKSKSARKFKNNQIPLLVSTKAFGMGIDKPNIRYTVHYGIPNSIESFYQEAGRSGRDRSQSRCVILISNDNVQRSKKMLDVRNSVDDIRVVMNDIPYSENDDITRILYFHISSFKGVKDEMEVLKKVLSLLGDVEQEKKIAIVAGDKIELKNYEKALYRLIVLGIVKDYTVDYSNRELMISIRGVDKYEIIDRYAEYVSGYNKSRVNIEAEKLQEFFDDEFGQFVINAANVLIDFIYDTIEKGRRRGIQEMLLLSEAAINADDPDKVIRERVLRYLETTYTEEIERVLNADKLGFNEIRGLLEGHENRNGSIIGGIRSPKDAAEIRGQVSRYLESTPDHTGLLILRALSELFCSDSNTKTLIETLNAAIMYAKEKVGYNQIEIDDFYNLIAWSCSKISEKDRSLYSEVISELLETFDDESFAKFAMNYLNKDEIYEPGLFFINKKTDQINSILRRK